MPGETVQIVFSDGVTVFGNVLKMDLEVDTIDCSTVGGPQVRTVSGQKMHLSVNVLEQANPAVEAEEIEAEPEPETKQDLENKDWGKF
ncbi:MAG: hypothetical protein JJ979_03510 [Roseibium sp.]|nr:hypothetical protein [Roseibium sp.]